MNPILSNPGEFIIYARTSNKKFVEFELRLRGDVEISHEPYGDDYKVEITAKNIVMIEHPITEQDNNPPITWEKILQGVTNE